MPVGQLTKAERQAALERLGVAFSDELVTGGTTLLLRALRAKQVTETRRTAHELAPGGEFEPLGNGLLCLLHGERSKTETHPAHGKAFVTRWTPYALDAGMQRARTEVSLIPNSQLRSTFRSVRIANAC